MVQGSKKSRSLRRVKTRIPAKGVVTHYTRRKASKAQCGACGAYLKGVPRLTNTQAKNLAKSKKRPERPYGGVLCSRCSRNAIVSRIRSILTLKKQ